MELQTTIDKSDLIDKPICSFISPLKKLIAFEITINMISMKSPPDDQNLPISGMSYRRPAFAQEIPRYKDNILSPSFICDKK